MLLLTMKLGGNVSKGILFFQGWIEMDILLFFFFFSFFYGAGTVYCHLTIEDTQA